MKEVEEYSDPSSEIVESPFLSPLEAHRRIVLSPLEVLMITSPNFESADATNQ